MQVTGQLENIGFAAGTDKSKKEHAFLDFYESALHSYRNEQFFLFEIGILFGNSLKTWAEYFSNATIVGLDIADHGHNIDLPPNAHRRYGDASDTAVLNMCMKEYGPPFIVVDDGSHLWDHQISALSFLWPRIVSGGMFIMEDIHTSFPAFNDRYRGNSIITTFDYLQKLQRWVVGNKYMHLPEGGVEKPFDDFIESHWMTVESMHFYQGTCIIHKKAA